jgi:hypothetical protein
MALPRHSPSIQHIDVELLSSLLDCLDLVFSNNVVTRIVVGDVPLGALADKKNRLWFRSIDVLLELACIVRSKAKGNTGAACLPGSRGQELCQH